MAWDDIDHVGIAEHEQALSEHTTDDANEQQDQSPDTTIEAPNQSTAFKPHNYHQRRIELEAIASPQELRRSKRIAQKKPGQ